MGNSAIELSVILPSYLEEENLRLLLPRLHDTLRKLTDSYEVIVMDTVAPLDNTRSVCEASGARYANRKPGNAFGDAVRSGILEARGEYMLFMDADGSHPPEFIPQLFRFIREYDIIIASRYIPGGYTENNRLQVFMSRALNFTYALVLNLDCKDVSNSFKIYRSSLLRGLSLRSNNFDIIEEILFKISKNNKNVKIKEVPFSFKKRMFGETKRNLLSFVATYLYTLLKLRFGK